MIDGPPIFVYLTLASNVENHWFRKCGLFFDKMIKKKSLVVFQCLKIESRDPTTETSIGQDLGISFKLFDVKDKNVYHQNNQQ